MSPDKSLSSLLNKLIVSSSFKFTLKDFNVSLNALILTLKIYYINNENLCYKKIVIIT